MFAGKHHTVIGILNYLFKVGPTKILCTKMPVTQTIPDLFVINVCGSFKIVATRKSDSQLSIRWFWMLCINRIWGVGGWREPTTQTLLTHAGVLWRSYRRHQSCTHPHGSSDVLFGGLQTPLLYAAGLVNAFPANCNWFQWTRRQSWTYHWWWWELLP